MPAKLPFDAQSECVQQQKKNKTFMLFNPFVYPCAPEKGAQPVETIESFWELLCTIVFLFISTPTVLAYTELYT